MENLAEKLNKNMRKEDVENLLEREGWKKQEMNFHDREWMHDRYKKKESMNTLYISDSEFGLEVYNNKGFEKKQSQTKRR